MGDVSGRELVTAVAIGNDLTCRMGSSIPLDVAKSRGWLTTDVFGTFGATAACARLLRCPWTRSATRSGLPSRSGRYARGLQRPQRVRAFRDDAGDVERLRSQGAVLAALMARPGSTARGQLRGRDRPVPDVLRRTGRSVGAAGRARPAVRVGRDGDQAEPWHVACVHPRRRAPRADPRHRAASRRDGAHPTEGMRAFTRWGEATSTDLQDANHSSPYLIARDPPRNGDIPRLTASGTRTSAWGQSPIWSSVAPDRRSGEAGPRKPGRNGSGSGASPDAVERDETIPYGHPQNPIYEEDLIAKLRTNAAYAARRMDEATIDRTIDVVLHLDDVADVNMILGRPD